MEATQDPSRFSSHTGMLVIAKDTNSEAKIQFVTLTELL